MAQTLPRTAEDRVDWKASAPFLGVQLLPLLAVFTGVHTRDLVLAAVLYWARMFAITAGYHRYFAHRSYRLARVPQFLLAFAGTTAAQKGPLWWAANHREHHKYTDTERDPHTPLKGFWWSHIGWVLSGRYSKVAPDAIPDFACYPELRFLDKHDWIGPWSLGLASFLVGGWSGLVIGFFGSTVLLWHCTFSVNSWAHIVGRRRYGTDDTSGNSLVIALLTMGEGWHNNHHHYPASARQGFFWWEVDPTYSVLRVLSWFGIVRELRSPPKKAKTARRLRSGHLDIGTLRVHLARAAATVPSHLSNVSEERIRQLKVAIGELSTQAQRLGRSARQVDAAG